jgi:hypothetical protein
MSDQEQYLVLLIVVLLIVLVLVPILIVAIDINNYYSNNPNKTD